MYKLCACSRRIYAVFLIALDSLLDHRCRIYMVYPAWCVSAFLPGGQGEDRRTKKRDEMAFSDLCSGELVGEGCGHVQVFSVKEENSSQPNSFHNSTAGQTNKNCQRTIFFLAEAPLLSKSAIDNVSEDGHNTVAVHTSAQRKALFTMAQSTQLALFARP